MESDEQERPVRLIRNGRFVLGGARPPVQANDGPYVRRVRNGRISYVRVTRDD